MELPSLEKGNTQKHVRVEALGSEVWFRLLSLSCTLAIQVDRLSRQLAVGTEVREEVRAGGNLQKRSQRSGRSTSWMSVFVLQNLTSGACEGSLFSWAWLCGGIFIGFRIRPAFEH